ncbi:hypothetical protein EI74_0781 [Mycoplasma testudineum]|uniref:Uncharacterized protein n=1 Tax=Mycoplasma testudineum TaxID=244584 RepID=A0A4R6IB31_9MOLU|nr:hypothetical protein [Mycoplasma testudineum]TDO19132.1 hypothetical protein EI74_0781 [Mycoplasma testudineum]
MQIKPVNDTSTLNLVAINQPRVQSVSFKGASTQELNSEQTVTFRIKSLFRFEKVINKLMLIFSLIVIIVAISLSLVNYFDPSLLLTAQVKQSFQNLNQGFEPIVYVYIFSAVLILFAIFKIASVSIDLGAIKKAEIAYRSQANSSNRNVNPYITKLYQKLILKQIDHNWITIFLLWFGGLFVAILFWLKNADWSIGNPEAFQLYIPITWNVWIKNAFVDPDLVVTLFLVILFAWIILHIVFALIRKKRKTDIEAFFSTGEFIDQDTIDRWISGRRKIWFRSFLLVNLFLIIIPVAYIIYQVIKRKKALKNAI